VAPTASAAAAAAAAVKVVAYTKKIMHMWDPHKAHKHYPTTSRLTAQMMKVNHLHHPVSYPAQASATSTHQGRLSCMAAKDCNCRKSACLFVSPP